MKTRWRSVAVVGLGFAMIVATAFLLGHRKEPVYQGKPLRYWVRRLGSDELHGAPKDAVEAIRAIGPKAVPFLLQWMPHAPRRPNVFTQVWQMCSELLHFKSQEDDEHLDPQDIEFAWWALGSEGKSAIPTLARVITRPFRTMDDYSAWTHSAKAISFLGADATAPMLIAATNMQGKHELWELLHNFENLGTNGAPAVPALIHWANHADYFVRSGVVSALGGIGKRPDLAVPVLLAALRDSNPMVRRDAAEALGAFADDSDAVLPALIKTLRGNDWEARGGAASGLGRIRSRPDIVVPLIAPYLYDGNSVVARSAAYALRDLGSRAALLALLRTTNNTLGVMGIRDIVYGAVEIISGEEEDKRRKNALSKLTAIYATGGAAPLAEPKIGGRLLSEILRTEPDSGPPLKLEQMLTLHQIATTDAEDTVTFELPLKYDAVTNTGTLRLLCDADPGEKLGDEAIIQECRRGTNGGNCWLAWDTSYEAPGQHFLQAELIVPDGHGTNADRIFKGPLFSFVSTNAVQCFSHADTYTDHGAFFRVKLAQPVGSYSLELTDPSGKHIHTITGSTTNGIVEAQWDLLYDGGKRFTGESFNTSWSVTYPRSLNPGLPPIGSGMGRQ